MSSKTNTGSTALLAVALFALPMVGIISRHHHQKKQQKAYEASLRAHCDAKEPLRPPFPPAVKNLLQTCRLAYLSTVDASNADGSSTTSPQLSSHLSLMRFTYLPSEEVIIMSTNRHTKKYDMLLQQRGVALLVHDFGGGGGSASATGEYSITLNGTCRILAEEDPRKERYRQAHLHHNPEYPQFIVGDHIAILCVDVRSARICNIADQVIHWNANDNNTIDNSEKSH